MIGALPGDVATDVKNTDGENAVAIGSAACTAIATIVTSYFGVKVANVAREDAVKATQDSTQTNQQIVATLAQLMQGRGQT